MSDPEVVDLRDIVTANDIRGRAGTQLTGAVARAIGAAIADHLDAAPLIVAHDMRLSSPELARALRDGAVTRGSTVADAGLSSTDQLYCASGLYDAAAVMVTASHNPPEDNGVKICRAGARPVGRDSGLEEIRERAEEYLRAGRVPTRQGGLATTLATLEDYVRTVHALVPLEGTRELRVVVDAANAMAGMTVPAVFEQDPSITIVPLHFELDGSFPHHMANPLDLSTLTELSSRVREERADLGLAFDGDADRCVIVDETGAPVDPSVITALIATREIARARAAGEERPTVIANLVSSRHVAEAVRAAGGEIVLTPVGHARIKAEMAARTAVFGGEHSAHYYFRDFFGADSGVLAARHVIAALAAGTGTLSQLVAEHRPYPTSGEINSRVRDVGAVLSRIRDRESERPGSQLDERDGLRVEHWEETAPAEQRWWFSVRSSNTEPLLRLTVEALEQRTMQRVRDELLELIRGEAPPAHGAVPGTAVPGWLREVLRCPDCAGELRDGVEVLHCRSCGREHPVQHGIPVLIAGRTPPPAPLSP